MNAATWDMKTVGNVSRLYMAARLSEESVAASGGMAAEATRSKLAAWLKAEARTFAVEVHVGDVEFSEREVDPFAVEIRARWAPSTHEVELSGGERDGKILQIERPGEPVRIPVSPPLSLAQPDRAPLPVMENILLYSLAGWRETERRWLYKVDA